MINAFLIIVLLIVLTTIAVFWYWGSKENEAQKEELKMQRMGKRTKENPKS